jgi:Choline dehydrogenase and related flavoproteins
MGYLVRALDRDNLLVLTDTQVNKILIDGNHAKGVECIGNDNNSFTINASKEVILSSGAFGFPQILLRSGVGPGNEITRHGIDYLVDLPGVGKNLQDHIDYITVHKYNSMKLIGFSLKNIFLKYLYEVLKYFFTKTGLFTSTVAEAGAFVKTKEELEIYNIQFHYALAMIVDHGRIRLWGTGMSCHSCLLRTKSRGEVTLSCVDSFEDSLIDPKFLRHSDDMKEMVEGYKIMMKVFSNDSFSKYIFDYTKRIIDIKDDVDIEKGMGEEGEKVYYLVGNCKMGNDDM